MRALAAGRDKCVCVYGDYTEVLCVLAAPRVAFILRRQKQSVHVSITFLFETISFEYCDWW